MNTSWTQHKRILFLISLPQTPEFANDKEEIDECLSELRELQVDVREHICQEDLSVANEYNVVIVIAHYDNVNDMLVLADDVMPIQDFVSYLPHDFSGLIDFCSCHSVVAFQAIKNRCPSCLAKVSLKTVPLLRRIIIYPSVIERFLGDDSLDYDTAFEQVSKEYDKILGEISDGRETEPEMAHLGQKKTSIYSPFEITKKSIVPIHVFLHYDAEESQISKQVYPNTNIHINSHDLKDVEIGDKLTITISFFGYDKEHVHEHVHVYGNDSKDVTVTDNKQEVRFFIGLDEEFCASDLGCSIDILKDDHIINKYPFFFKVIDIETSIRNDDAICNPHHLVDFSTKKKFKTEKGGSVTNLSEIYEWLINKNIISDEISKQYLWDCISHADFSSIYIDPNKKNILCFIYCLTKYYPKEWKENACKSINVTPKRLSQNKPKNFKEFYDNITLKIK